VPRACGLGDSFSGALDSLAAATPRLRPLADALLASDRLGAPVGDALARLAAEERSALRRRAETAARTVPVRLLFPLVFLVLPAFGLLTVVPTLVSGLART
jgi:tight adherence protein C